MNVASGHLQWQVQADMRQTRFFVQGMHCANCANSIRSNLGRLPGVRAVEVDLPGNRVSVAWQPAQTSIETVLRAVAALGFQPVPLSGDQALSLRQRERRTLLKRIGLAGLVAMQMSMYTVGLYAGAISGIDGDMAWLLRVTSMVLATPVLFYSGAPFLGGAWRDLKAHRLGMDVPVAAALLLAFVASVANTLRDRGEVYFDSVAMFVFFLLLGRFIESGVRRAHLDTSEALLRTLPAEAIRLLEHGSERIALQRIRQGDRLLIPHGAVVPVDAELVGTAAPDGAQLDESLISGESRPVERPIGARLVSGSINLSQALTVRACSDMQGSTLSALMRLVERCGQQRPRAAELAERTAVHFVAVILVLAAVVAGLWLWIDPSRAFAATLAVLVVTCPCALSLATPVAGAAAVTRLARMGIIVTRASALEQLATVDTVVLDKTGTLTTQELQVRCAYLAPTAQESTCLAIAATLEQGSGHPIAAALLRAATPGVPAGELHEFAGRGIEGVIDRRRWRCGRADYVAQLSHGALPMVAGAGSDELLWLGHEGAVVAAFTLHDPLRGDALQAVRELRAAGLEPIIASGDHAGAVREAATRLELTRTHSRLEPLDKLQLVRELQRQGHRVLMVGDGINDAPVLAAADVSCAMGRGAALAQSAADLLLMNERLASLAAAARTAHGYLRLVRGNLRWALAYNLCAVPLAALGLIPPWLAAIGMSASSLLVVWRAQRFARRST
ncbi:MAG: cation-translocating P-type ATPase [Steroidobacteraceae bacterium]